MSTSAEVQSAWADHVFANATIKAISSKAYGYAVTEDSEAEIEKFYLDGEINFFEYYVGRGVQRANQEELHSFTVWVNYYREKDVSGESWQAVRDAFETIHTIVKSALGDTWDSTVDFWQPQPEPPEIIEASLGDVAVWRGSYKFIATSSVSI